VFAKVTDPDGWNWRTLVWMFRHGEWAFRRQRPFQFGVGYFWYDGPVFYVRAGVLAISLS